MGMYLNFFGLKEPPFSTESDPKFFFETPIHGEAMASMLYAIQDRKGMVLITGEVGSGKTFLSSMLASRLDGNCQIIAVRHPPNSGKQLLKAVAQALDLQSSPEDDRQSLTARLVDHLEKLGRRRTVAVIFDEAQDVPDGVLEEIRLMWNWDFEGRRLIQIVLVGQPQLRDRLQKDRWESMQQRVAVSYHLGRLGLKDTGSYILHRRNVAAGGSESPLKFSMDALQAIHKASGGVPRLINIMCDNCLLTAYSKSVYAVTSGIVADVLKNMTFWYRDQLPSTNDVSELA